MNLTFGLGHAVPEAVTTAWGARWIYPADMLWDRQGWAGDDVAKAALRSWLNREGLPKAKAAAARAAANFQIEPTGYQAVILYRDDLGVIVADPRGSCGYLYVAAWLHDSNPLRQPGADYKPLVKPESRASKARRARTK